jgi:2,4-dienoyl-CoA reductase-like NADH-dependent reductase (Old Yellow Enzyme family)
MAELFEGTSINGMSLANRFVRSATWEGWADEHGAVTARLTEMMVELARGEVGLIFQALGITIENGKLTCSFGEKNFLENNSCYSATDINTVKRDAKEHTMSSQNSFFVVYI